MSNVSHRVHFKLLFTVALILMQFTFFLEAVLTNELIHEAYITPIRGTAILESAPIRPPSPINERILPRPKATWISGYWIWSEANQDFIWVTGVWRNPPPGLQWIPSQWIQMEQGWVRLRGFWSPLSQENLTFIQLIPPDQIDENAGNSSENEFWRPGFWEYSFESQQYHWIIGSWEALDPNWVFVPDHYEWRPQGYIFIPGYWDWPLERRGVAYTPVLISFNEREGGVYEPEKLETPEELIPMLTLYYPDYLYLIMHHSHYHPEAWASLASPWWMWKPWWGFSWQSHWALWWWYTHPGYPQPKWLTSDDAHKISPPSQYLLRLAKNVVQPLILTPFGVVPPIDIINVLRKEKGAHKVAPVLPSNPKSVLDILLKAYPKEIGPNKILYPIGPIQTLRKHPLNSQQIHPLFSFPKIPSKQGRLPRKPVVQGGAMEFPASVPEHKATVTPQVYPVTPEEKEPERDVEKRPAPSVIKPLPYPPTLEHPGIPKEE